MSNYVPCLIAFAFLGASLYTMIKCQECDEFRASLGPILNKAYDMSVNERMNIYLQGLALGIVLALIYLWFTLRTINPLANVCIFTMIAFATQYLYYMLMPKQIHMLPLLRNEEQIRGWYNVYNSMKVKYITGMILGALGFVFLSWSLIKLGNK